MGRRNGLTLVQVRLETGRSHQIRVQFAHSGHPLWGDARYGNGAPGEQIALFGAGLTLVHPVRKEPMFFRAFPKNAEPWSAFQEEIRETSDDTIVYFTMHTERSDDGSRVKAKTAGKMIDSQLTLESLFSIVLYCVTDGKRHYFVTQSDGVTTAKSPMDMFDLEIDNDLKAVDTTIREYYGLAANGTPVEKKEEKKPVPGASRQIKAELTDKIPE